MYTYIFKIKMYKQYCVRNCKTYSPVLWEAAFKGAL